MSYTTERVSYLQGLLEGLGISDATPEGKMIGKIVDVLEDIADAIDELDETLVDMDQRVDELDEDLANIEDIVYDECDCCGEEEDDDFLEIACPHCNEIIYFDQDALTEDDLICPACGQSIFTDTETEEDTSAE